LTHRLAALGLALVSGVVGPHGDDADLNFFEWIRVAPIVVSGQSLGQDGKTWEFRIEHTLRGDLEAGATVRIDLRQANSTRNRRLYPKALKLDSEMEYILLLEPATDGKPVYWLSRGILGARELPAEGAPALIASLARFVELQDANNETLLWVRLAEMLEETNPILLETALEQFLKFRRGTPDELLTVRPLLAHPSADVREMGCQLLEQIIVRYLDEGIPEEEALRAELVGTARRDPSIPVRVAAAVALSGFPDVAVERVLEEIADEDPEQAVRYVAEKLLYEREQAEQAAAKSPR
jgi:hypothetical protein